jgi:hypothetical protein
MNAREVVEKNLRWFERSGIMRPADGFWGVAERLSVTQGNEATDSINRSFPSQSPLGDGAVVLEHRRPDCCVEVALLMDRASAWLGRPGLKTVADNLIEYLMRRSVLRNEAADSPAVDLWGWANPIRRDGYWVDDNAWVVTCFLLLAGAGRAELVEPAVKAARTLLRHVNECFEHLAREDRGVTYQAKINGVLLNPHWIGLATMAFAHAAAHDPQTDYAATVRKYYDVVLDGAPDHLTHVGRSELGLPWPMSEYAYLSMTAAIAAAKFRDPRIEKVARESADLLARHQSREGHWPAEHFETPVAAHLADLIYTQNWATLGLYHCGRVLGEKRYLDACRKSLEFLARIQDRRDDPRFAGCWRGMYDLRAGAWGGGDLFEGGAGSIYSGWTNAPIALAFVLEATGTDLLA